MTQQAERCLLCRPRDMQADGYAGRSRKQRLVAKTKAIVETARESKNTIL